MSKQEPKSLDDIKIVEQKCKICGKPVGLDDFSKKMLSFFGDVGGAHAECLNKPPKQPTKKKGKGDANKAA